MSPHPKSEAIRKAVIVNLMTFGRAFAEQEERRIALANIGETVISCLFFIT
jgi:hypothetical protein